MKVIEVVRVDRKLWIGEVVRIWRKRGKCLFILMEIVFIFLLFGIFRNINIYLVVGDGLMEIEGLISVYLNIFIKSIFFKDEDFKVMYGNIKVVLDYYVFINSDLYMVIYFGNMDKMVSVMRVFKGRFKILFLSRRVFVELIL